MLIQLIEGLTAAFTRQFPRFLTRDQREHQRSDGPQARPRPISKYENLDSPLVFIRFSSLLLQYNLEASDSTVC